MSTLTKQTHHCLQKLKQCSTNQSYHLSKCNLSNSKNNLPYLIEQINWTHITFLNLSSNNLKDVSFLSSVGQMTTLNLSNNCLNSISVLIDCVHLISLDCSYNEITELPELNRLKFLEKLNASNNPLNSISGLWGCKNLRDLNLSACNLTSSLLSGLDENEIQLGAIDPFEKVSGLSNVSKLPNFPTTNHNLRPTLLGIPNLRILNLSYNPRIFHALCIQFNRQCGISNDTSMNNLNRTDCSMFNVLEGNMNDVNGFGLFPYKIEYLNLQACDINFINGLSHMKRLHTLNLSYNQIMDIQILKPLKPLLCLQNLNLKNNPICDQNNYLGKVVCCLKQLKILDDCQLTILDKVRSFTYNEPSLKDVAKQDHRVNLLHQYTKSMKLRDCTLPNLDTPYPILAIIGPAGINKRQLRQQLVTKLENYFASLVCHTNRSPRLKEGSQLLISPKPPMDNLASSSPQINTDTNMPQKREWMKSSLDYDAGYPKEYDGIDYYFVNTENFYKKQTSGGFIQTAKIMDYQYGLSWEALDGIARQGLAGIVVGEIELLYGLQLAGLKPRSILCLPSDLVNYEAKLRKKLCQLDNQQFSTLSNNGILEAAIEKSEEWIHWCVERTIHLYPEVHRDNPGMFDTVLSSDNTQELAEQLLFLVYDYLGLNHVNECCHMLPSVNSPDEVEKCLKSTTA